MVLRMLDGEWGTDAEGRLADFFAAEVRELLPPAELSCNPELSIHAQKSILYDESPEVHADGVDPEDMAPVLPEELWPLMQDRLLKQSAMQECLVRIDVDRSVKSISYRVVPASMVANVKADPHRPDRPTGLEELRLFREPVTGDLVWAWEVWDYSDPKAPKYEVHRIDATGKRTDATADLYRLADGTPATDVPYRDKAGQPILPYILFHARVGNRLFSPFRGREVVSGTLTAAALWTMWVGGVRDGAHPQRAIIDGNVATVATPRPVAGSQVRVVRMNPMAILEIKSDGANGRASIGQWQPAMDPKAAGEAIEAFVASLAVYADLSPSDITLGTSGKSGYAIVVSREGLRRAQKRMIPPCRMGDRLMLATASRMANAEIGTALPEDPKAWHIDYHDVGETPAEEKAEAEAEAAERENILAKRDAGMLHPVDAFMEVNDIEDRAEAERMMAEIEAWKTQRAAERQPLPPPPDDPAPA